MRVLVCGGRNYPDREAVFRELDRLATIDEDQMLPPSGFVVIHGGCRTGADQHADDWGVVNWVPIEEFPADWSKHGRAAGPIRNREMIEVGKPDLVLAFPGGAGTADMVHQARRAGIEVREIEA